MSIHHQLNVIEEEINEAVRRMMRAGNLLGKFRLYLDGNKPSPAKPRPRRQFNDDMLQLLHERGVLREKPNRSVVQRSPFSLDDLLSDLIEEYLSDPRPSENSSPASDASGPPRAKPATPARRATSSNVTKPAKRGKGGK